MFYPKAKKGELTEDQKQVNDNLVVIAGSAAGGLASGSLSGVGSGANTAENEVENNALSDERPTLYVTPGDAAIAQAQKDAALSLDKMAREIKDALDKATQCTLGRVCSDSTLNPDDAINPNIGKDLTDTAKAELGGPGPMRVKLNLNRIKLMSVIHRLYLLKIKWEY